MARLEVHVEHHVTQGYALTFDYDERMVRAIKTRVKAGDRTYDPRTHTWWIHQRNDLDALRFATNGWSTFVRTDLSATG
jgi:hypothetical protein